MDTGANRVVTFCEDDASGLQSGADGRQITGMRRMGAAFKICDCLSPDAGGLGEVRL